MKKLEKINITEFKKQTESYPNYLFGEDKEYEIVIANTIDLRLKAWGLVFENYLKKGYAKEQADNFWYGIHDAMPSTTTFLTLKNGKAVATLSIVFDSEIGLPADKLFSSELNKMRKADKHPFEIISLACNCGGLKESTNVLMHMFTLSHITARYKHNATDWIITVNPKHVGYYKKMMFFEQVGDIKNYNKVGGAIAVLLTMDNETIREKFRVKYGVKNHTAFLDNPVLEHRIFRFLRRNQHPLKWNDVKDWFENKKHLLSQLPKNVFKRIAIISNTDVTVNYTQIFKYQ